jgi:hypothetical protein
MRKNLGLDQQMAIHQILLSQQRRQQQQQQQQQQKQHYESTVSAKDYYSEAPYHYGHLHLGRLRLVIAFSLSYLLFSTLLLDIFCHLTSYSPWMKAGISRRWWLRLYQSIDGWLYWKAPTHGSCLETAKTTTSPLCFPLCVKCLDG